MTLLLISCAAFCLGMGACVMRLLSDRDALRAENAGLRELVVDPNTPEPAFDPIDHREQHDLRRAYERDQWAGEWNSLPTAIDRLMRHRGEAYAERHRQRADDLLGPNTWPTPDTDTTDTTDTTDRTTP